MGTELDVMMEASKGTLSEHLGIKLVEISKERVVGTMPVEKRVHQPFGLLHGGASVALAETLASLGAWMTVYESGRGAVGLEINANHVRGKREGLVTGTAVPLHLGRSTHVWEIRLTDEAGKLVCISRCTMAIVDA